MTKYAIVDDQEVDRLLIEAMAAKYPDFILIGSFENPLAAMALLRDNPTDLLFLDVEMPIMSGPEFLRGLAHPPPCVFITSHPDYAVEAFELYAIDYILKPLKQERFDASIQRFLAYQEIRKKADYYELHLASDTITIREGYDTYRVNVKDVLYLEALKDYTRIFTTNKSYITLGSLGTIVENFPVDIVKRIHRSYAVNTLKIASIKDYTVQVCGVELPVGKTFRKELALFTKELK